MGETSKGWEGSDPGLRDLAELLEPGTGLVKINQIRHELEKLLVLGNHDGAGRQQQLLTHVSIHRHIIGLRSLALHQHRVAGQQRGGRSSGLLRLGVGR